MDSDQRVLVYLICQRLITLVRRHLDQLQQEKYRYGYQGQYAEMDTTTGWNAFEARDYDPVIGRWMVPDPAREFYSPYLAYSNNPLLFIDPDGRDVFIYYISAGFGDIFGHNAIGVQLDPNGPVYYYPASGYVDGSTGKAEIGGYNWEGRLMNMPDEAKTFQQYLEDGNTIYKLRIPLEKTLEVGMAQDIVDLNNGTPSGAAWCTLRVKQLLFENLKLKYGEEKANQMVSEIMPQLFPHGTELDPEILKDAGFTEMIKIYKGGNGNINTESTNLNE